MADENQNEIVEENQTEGLMGGVPTEEPKTPDPSETEIPHKEEEKPQEQAEAKEDKKVLEKLKPDAAMFLGDTNTVISCIAAAQLNIPIIHFEGLMRSYDWRMPEEKYRGIIDHLSDVIYSYYPEYKKQGIDEGINPKAIVIVTNPIVDILNKYLLRSLKGYNLFCQNQISIRMV